jgi:tRNA-specific 2-thiouridylase
VEDVRWIEVEAPAPGAAFEVEARIRHASRPQPARLEVHAAGAVEVRFAEPAFAPAPGQALVAYVGDAVLCGGTLAARQGAR